MVARVRFLLWLGVRPEDAPGEAAAAPRAPGPAGASREAWLGDFGLDEASLLEWSAAAEPAREVRRTRRRSADVHGGP